MQEVRAKQLETVKNHLRTALRPRVNEIVTACVQNEIATRVHHEVSICASCDRATESHLACAAHGASPCIAAGLAPPVQASDHGSKEEPPQLVSALIFLMDACSPQSDRFLFAYHLHGLFNILHAFSRDYSIYDGSVLPCVHLLRLRTGLFILPSARR